tara:strand:+ start:234 stop:407 length:174 start_codon:yes stop_codon:yes gene_type:complete
LIDKGFWGETNSLADLGQNAAVGRAAFAGGKGWASVDSFIFFDEFLGLLVLGAFRGY